MDKCLRKYNAYNRSNKQSPFYLLSSLLYLNPRRDASMDMFRKILRCIAVFILLAVACIPVSGQYYGTGANPARVKWNRIRGENFTVIYPREIDSLARRYLGLLEMARPRVLSGLEINPKSLPVVLNPYTVNSNGVVVWAPKRVELFTLPPANGTYAHNWEEQLALHESRHIGQISHFTKGVFRPLGWFIGEQSPGVGVGVYPSRWFLEGDAVMTETELSSSGRGRSADFMEYYRAAFLNGEYRNWDRWRYGSYKYYTPDIYALGYLINGTVRYQTDNYLYSGELLDYYVRNFYNPNVAGAAYREIAGASRREYLERGEKLMTSLWKEEYGRRGAFTRPEPLPYHRSEYYTEYKYNVPIGPDSLAVVKYAFDGPSALVLLSGSEAFRKEHRSGEKILRAFSDRTGNLHGAGDKIYWTETVPDFRWEKETFGNLFMYDLRTRKITRLSNRAYYNNPSVSPDGRIVSVAEYCVTGGSNLVGLNALTGEKIFSVPAPEGGQLLESAWVGDTVYAIVITLQGEGIFRIAPGKAGDPSGRGSWERVIKEQRQNMKFLRSSGNRLYFTADFDGVNNIYLYDTENKAFGRLTNAKYAAYYPAIQGNRLYYSDLRSDGFFPVSIRLDSAMTRIYADAGNGIADTGEVYLKEGEIRNIYKYPIAEKLSEQARDYFARENIPSDNGEKMDDARHAKSEKYRRGWNLFRFHSWGPIYYNVDNIMSMTADHFYELVSAGATVYSQNTLGTAVTMLGYSYRNGFNAGHLKFTYSGWLPVLEVGADYNHEDRYRYRILKKEDELYVLQRETSENPFLELSVRAYLPVNLSSRGWQRGLIPQVKWEFENTEYYSYRSEKYEYLNQLDFALQYYQNRPVAKAEIFPKWGFSITARAGMAPGGKENFGSVASLYSYFYLPGIAPKQGVRFTLGWQKQFVNGKSYYLSNLLDMPRGYEEFPLADYLQCSVDYAVPIYLGDKSLGGIAYLQRLKLIPFADYAYNKYYTGKYNMYSLGADVMIDTYLFRIGVPLSLGLRYARTEEGRNFVGFLFSTSLFNR